MMLPDILHPADIIIKRLGQTTLRKLGAHEIQLLDNGIQFRISGSKRVTHIQIALSWDALCYVIYFYKAGKNIKRVAQYDQVYNWDMHPIIEKETGIT